MIRREWTQSDLARRLGISAAYLSLVMKGRRTVPVLESRILGELGVSGQPASRSSSEGA
ncbi:MAG: helix-turn-helix transcriptional regulator [Nitrospiraceae bacterium]|nr:helix-turn-helix transcriptional regulator [Nitrospiraceae bacterium]